MVASTGALLKSCSEIFANFTRAYRDRSLFYQVSGLQLATL